jgi:fructose-specific phosphotransferase system IIC component
MEAVIIGLAAAFNMLVIKWKLESERTADAILDITFLTILSTLFSGSMGGMIIATIASAATSLALYFNPPTFHKKLFKGLL